jgi:ABC-2 type transport system ATP-binding protein
MIQAVSLHKNYGEHPALVDLNLSVSPGEIFCLLGANGAGKTTTINLILGFIEATSGQVLVDGQSISQASNSSMAYIPENLNLYEELTGLKNLKYFTGIGGDALTEDEAKKMLLAVELPESAIQKRVKGYLRECDKKLELRLQRQKKPGTYS